MWSLISFSLLVAAAGQAHGVELHLSAANLMRTDDSLPCGTVQCVDEVDTSKGHSIKSLQIRKQLNREVLVNLTQEDNYLDCKFDGITAHGNWTSQRAEAKLTLYNSHDCDDAKFICEIVHLNKLGVERVSSSSGRINGKLDRQIQELSSSLADAESKVEQQQQHLTKSDAKIDELSSSLAKAESKVEQLTSSLADAENKSDRKIQKLSSSLADAESKVEQLTSSLANVESKVEQLTKSDSKILNKLDTLTDTMHEVKKQQPPTTCPRSARPPPNMSYQVVYPIDGAPSYLCGTDGGWTIIQRRIDGTTDFYRNWFSYKHGFGSYFERNIWLGLERIHQITSSSNHELKITIKYEGKFYYAHYDNFRVSGEEDNYRLSIGAYTGTAGDTLKYGNNSPFSTYDEDNGSHWMNCAKAHIGAWWYGSCKPTTANLNGKWGTKWYKGLRWHKMKSLTTMTEMKIRRML